MSRSLSFASIEEATAEQSFVEDLFTKLNRRKTFIVGLTIVFFLLLGMGIQFLPKTYTAGSAIEVDGEAPKLVSINDVTKEIAFDDQTIGTEMSVLQSREMLAAVIRQLNLTENPEFNPYLKTSFVGEIKGKVFGALEEVGVLPPSEPIDETRIFDETIGQLRKHITIRPVPRSRVIDVEVRSKNRNTAANIANSFAKLYIDNQLDIKRQIAEKTQTWIDPKVQELGKQASDAAHKVETYRIAHGLTTGQTTTIAQEQYTQTSTELTAAQGRVATLEAQLAAAKSTRDPERLAAVVGSQTIGRLREQEATIAANKAQLLTRYAAGSRQAEGLNEQLRSIRGQIASEANRIVQSLTSELRSAQDNVKNLTTRLDQMRAEVAKVEISRAHLTELQSEADSARKVYNDFLASSKTMNAQLVAPFTKLRVISNAAPPSRPSFPDNAIMLPGALIVGFMMSAGLAYVAESRRKGLFTKENVQDVLGLPTLGMLPVRNRRTEVMYADGIEAILNRLLHDHGTRSILVTSALPQEGKTTTASALAKAATDRGIRVLLVDADMHSIHPLQKTKAVRAIGLSEAVRGALQNQQDESTERLMIPSDRRDIKPLPLISMPVMSDVMNQLKEQHDLVIVDAPPVLVGGDCWMLSRYVEHTVLIAAWGDTHPDQVSLALDQLLASHDERHPAMAGVILNKVNPRKCVKLGTRESILFKRNIYDYGRRS